MRAEAFGFLVQETKLGRGQSDADPHQVGKGPGEGK